MAAAIAQTIAVVDKSGKVVSTSKQLKNVFMEARFAYQERKAEIVAERKVKSTSLHEKDLRRAVTDLSIGDAQSDRTGSTRRHHSHRHGESRRRPRPDGLARQHSVSSVASPRRRHDDSARRSSASSPRSPPANLGASQRSGSAPTSPVSAHHRPSRSPSLVRRRTDLELDLAQPSAHQQNGPVRSMSTSAVDMNLAYGEYHPACIAPLPDTDAAAEKEFITLVERAKKLLDEAECAQYSVQAMIAHLQKNPEAMAAVALTLAEISNVVSKMAPGALTMLKGSAPAVFALLASPQFLIAAGVGIGVTVVMFGGYKIVKKIKAKNAANKEGSMDEMVEVDSVEIDRIQQWRRGIVAAGAADGAIVTSPSDAGTSVDGEFITPLAASMRGMETRDDLSGLSPRERKKREKKDKKDKKHSKEGSKNKNKENSKTAKKASRAAAGPGSTASEPSTTGSSTRISSSPAEAARRALVKVTRPSPLRHLLS